MRQVLGPRNALAASKGALLADLRRRQGRLAEAEAELGDAAALVRTYVGAQHEATLQVEAIAARLRHAQSGGAAAAAAELRAVVARMHEFLGATHYLTLKYQAALDAMGLSERDQR